MRSCQQPDGFRVCVRLPWALPLSDPSLAMYSLSLFHPSCCVCWCVVEVSVVNLACLYPAYKMLNRTFSRMCMTKTMEQCTSLSLMLFLPRGGPLMPFKGHHVPEKSGSVDCREFTAWECGPARKIAYSSPPTCTLQPPSTYQIDTARIVWVLSLSLSRLYNTWIDVAFITF